MGSFICYVKPGEREGDRTGRKEGHLHLLKRAMLRGVTGGGVGFKNGTTGVAQQVNDTTEQNDFRENKAVRFHNLLHKHFQIVHKCAQLP